MSQHADSRPHARSLPRAIVLGVVLSAVVLPSLHWLTLVIFRELPDPPSVWAGYLAVRAIAGVGLGAGLYAAGRLRHGSLRHYLNGVLLFLFIGGDVEDFASDSLGGFLFTWVASSLLAGALLGTVLSLWARISRSHTVPDRRP